MEIFETDEHKQEFLKEVFENLCNEIVEDVTVVFEDCIGNFEDKIYNSIRSHHDKYDDYEIDLEKKSFYIAYSEETDLDLYTSKEIAIEDFEQKIKYLLHQKIQDYLTDLEVRAEINLG